MTQLSEYAARVRIFFSSSAAHIDTRAHIRKDTGKYICVCVYMHKCMHAHEHTHTCACTHNTQACTCARRPFIIIITVYDSTITRQPCSPSESPVSPCTSRVYLPAPLPPGSPRFPQVVQDTIHGQPGRAGSFPVSSNGTISHGDISRLTQGANHGPRASSRVFARLLCPRHLLKLPSSEP